MKNDEESKELLRRIEQTELARARRIAGVRSVLIVLPSFGLVFDADSIRRKILHSYPDATVFFLNTNGTALGAPPPENVDLLIDLTGPGHRQALGLARKLRRMSRVAVGRKTGLLKSRIYDSIYDESAEDPHLTPAMKELCIQKKVFGLAGVVISLSGDPLPDKSAMIPRELPPLLRSPSLL